MKRSLLFAALLALTACAPLAGWIQGGPPSTHRPVERSAPTKYDTAILDVAPLKYRWTPDELAKACEAAEKISDSALATLVAVPDETRTFSGSFEAYDEIIA